MFRSLIQDTPFEDPIAKYGRDEADRQIDDNELDNLECDSL